MYLSDDHKKMLLGESSIAQEVVEAREYRTVNKKVELKSLGFSDSQRNVPGLLIPVYSSTGEIATYQFRPDKPRIKDGKPVKYEAPSGTRMVLDVHPFAREMLGDPNVPLYVTEGIKKGDVLTSRNLCATTLLGVWNFRGTNARGGKVALHHWEYVALNGRRVYIVFDSDVMLKPQVHEALARLKVFLGGRGAEEAAAIYLPPGDGGAKQGVDDFLAAGHSTEDLLNLARVELKEPPEGTEFADQPDTQAAELIRYAQDAKLFHTPDGKAYVIFPVEEG